MNNRRSKSNFNSPERQNEKTLSNTTPQILPRYKVNPDTIRKNKELLKNNLSVKNRKDKPKGDGTKLIPYQMSDDATRKLEGLQDDDTASLRGVILPSINTSMASLGIYKKRNHVITHKAHNIISRKADIDVKRK